MPKAESTGRIGVVFYDMTPLYFETPDEDDLWKIGYSKDGKHQHPQIKLGLLVGPEGYPLGYDIFEGNTYEDHTLIPVLESIEKKFSIGKPVVIADAGLLSNANINSLTNLGYKFVLGGKIRNEGKGGKEAIQRLEISEDKPREVTKDGYRLIISFSEKRMKKDAQCDGLKGYLTNTDMKPNEVIAAYGNLWQIEKAFRINKTDIRIRPVYHRIPKRIQTHICICFVSYAVFKELERTLKTKKVAFSANRAVELTKNMYQKECFTRLKNMYGNTFKTNQ